MGSELDNCDPKRLAALIETEAVSPAVPLTEGAGTRIGRYKLLQPIGEGGFGTVFMAEQETPVSRKVALKIIKLGMDTKLVIARFEAERQALAMMDHPNIAKVFDAGSTDVGRPYFVMELVKGIPITEYCDRAHLNPRQRLELFTAVCKAVQHAHQKGIIHRDIKPSNVLVTLHDGTPVPKVIDFGIAKAINQRLTEHTLFTEYRQLIGTPEYTSPEQADLSGLDVDTRSDIYSLGVLLYELLTGTTPLDSKQLRAGGHAEIQRMIREVEPPRPSTRLSTLGAGLSTLAVQMATEPKKLTRLLAGEVDWIVMKCLEKDRNRRYETANALAMDVQRHLTGDRVEASPPSNLYRIRKFARKYNLAMSVASLLVVATGISSWQAVRATRAIGIARRAADSEATQRSLAERAASNETAQRKQAEAVAGLLESIFKRLDPFALQNGETDLRAQLILELDGVAASLQNEYPAEPLVRARLRNALGTTQLGLGEAAKAEVLFRTALEEQRSVVGRDDPSVMVTLGNLAAVYSGQQSRYAEAAELLEQVRDQRVKVLGRNSPDTLVTMGSLAEVYARSGRSTEAIMLLEQVRVELRKTLGPNHSNIWPITASLAYQYLTVGRTAEALELYKGLRDHQTLQLGADHPDTLHTLFYLAIAYEQNGQIVEALSIREQALDGQLTKFTTGHPEIQNTMRLLADDYRALGRTADAGKILDRLRDQVEHSLQQKTAALTGNPANPALLTERGGLFARLGMFREAVDDYLRAIDLGPQNAARWHNGVPLLLQVGDVEGYQRRRSQELQQFAHTTDAIAASKAAKDSMLLALDGEELTLAAGLADRALATNPNYIWFTMGKGMAEYRLRHYQQAIRWLQISPPHLVNPFFLVERDLFLAMSYWQSGKQTEARQTLARAVFLMETELPKASPELLKVGEWNICDWILCQVVRREAEALINDTSSTTRKSEQ